MTEPTTDPIVKELMVPVSPRKAFRLFTAGMGTWWPVESHSVSRESSATVVFEEWAGGRIYEFTPSGEEHVWGRVIAWNPPEAVAFSWHPGRAETTAQRVDVTFTPVEQQTKVTLTHSGWDALGPNAARTRSGYTSGWDLVFGDRYGNAAGLEDAVS